MAPEVARTVQAAYDAAARQFAVCNPNSHALYQAATRSLPGGNTRSVLYYDPFPLYTDKAHGCRIWDADGHEYVDFLGEYTAGLYGHSHPVIMQAIQTALARGLSFGSHHSDEARLAALIRERFASIELVRFTNSGTEATLMALAAAKIYTNRSKVLVFDGGYHGGGFMFKNGSHPINVPHDYLMAQYNDIASVDKIIDGNENDTAAIIVEPMIGSGGCIPGKPEFLAHLRRRASDIGAILIFDEVMTSRLFSGGGVQTELGIVPDLTTLGKYIGGGMSFGAFGGKKEVMSMYDPRASSHSKGGAPVPHAGTFNNNVLTMAAGSAGLESVFTSAEAKSLHARGEALREKICELSQGTLLKVTGYGSIMALHFTRRRADEIATIQDLKDNNYALLDLLHLDMLSRGFYIARRGFIALSLALTSTELDAFAAAIQNFLAKYAQLVSE